MIPDVLKFICDFISCVDNIMFALSVKRICVMCDLCSHSEPGHPGFVSSVHVIQEIRFSAFIKYFVKNLPYWSWLMARDVVVRCDTLWPTVGMTVELHCASHCAFRARTPRFLLHVVCPTVYSSLKLSAYVSV